VVAQGVAMVQVEVVAIMAHDDNHAKEENN
jgi:hypothetical protein